MSLTKEEILAFEPDVFLKKIANPETRAEIEAVWNAQPEAPGGAIAVEETPVAPAPTPEEQAEADRVTAETAKAEAERVASEAAKAEQVRKDAEQKARTDAEAKKQRLVLDYQVTDPESGQPIGNRTHLEADTWEEMSDKQKIAHEHATRALHRFKNRKVTTKAEEPSKPQLTDAELQAAVAEIRKGDDPKAAVAALRKVAGAEDAEAERQALKQKQSELDAQAISYDFMRRHLHDFNSCDANGKIIGQYIIDNNLAWTLDNLEEAFDQEKEKLAPVAMPAAPAVLAPTPVPANPEPIAPVTTVTAPVIETPVAPPVVPAPTEPPAPVAAAEPTPAVAAPNPPAPRKVPNSGIVPGTTAGRPVSTAPAGLTKQDIAKMNNVELRRRMRDPKLRAEIERVANS